MKISAAASDLDGFHDFLKESKEHLESIEENVLALGNPPDAELVDLLFRRLHTIKGVASFLGLGDIQKLSHALESAFDRLRQGTLASDDACKQALLASLDSLKHMVHAVDEGVAGLRQEGGGIVMDIREVGFAGEYAALEDLLEGRAPGRGACEAAAAPAGEEDLVTPEMAQAFVKEAEDTLESCEQNFLKLGANFDDTENLHQAFRLIHSFKGNCGFFGFGDLEKLSHRLENLLDLSRTRGGPVSGEVVMAGLDTLDALRGVLRKLAKEGNAPVPNLSGRLAEMDRIAGALGKHMPSGGAPLGELLVQQNAASPEDIAKALEIQQRPLGRILVEAGLVAQEAVDTALASQKSAKPRPDAAREAAKAPPRDERRDLRVDLAKLDLLLDLVGELVISTGMVFNHPLLKAGGGEDLEKAAHQLKGVVSELQNVALGVRMIPVAGVFRKMTRLVHDVAGKSGKKARLVLRGEETEIDKNVADLIADPLVHMIRNSIDHGLEAPADRAAAGKDDTGTVSLEAGQEGGDILISVRDDGRGLDRSRILAKARERGLAGAEGDSLPDQDVFQFIFMPGFSTAEAVTSTSGRGVGMDVVKSNIDRLNGRISIQSEPGKGACISLRIPLTLSILEGMMVRVGDSLFILPLHSVRETIAPRADQVFALPDGQEMLKLRGRTLPIVRLHRLHGIPAGVEDIPRGLLVSLEARGVSFCLLVDELVGQRQTVVKALPPYLGGIPGVSSCSILDNGEISLILDVAGILELHQSHQGGGDSWTAVAAAAAPAGASA